AAEGGRRLQEGHPACARFVVTVGFRVVGGLAERIHNAFGRGLVGIADAHVNQVFAFGQSLALERGDLPEQVGRYFVQALGASDQISFSSKSRIGLCLAIVYPLRPQTSPTARRAL